MDPDSLRHRFVHATHQPVAATLIGVAGIAGTFQLERATQPDLSFELLYLLFVALVAWSSPRAWHYGPFAVVAALLHVSSGLLRAPPDDGSLTFGWNAVVHVVMFLLAGSAVATLRRSYARERESAATDALTGVLSRRRFLHVLEQEAARAHRYRRPHSLAFIDLDRFREVNNRYGHRRGDEVLRACAAAMRGAIRETDVLGRIGGDEFALLLPETGPEAAVAVQKVRDAVLRVAAEQDLAKTLGVSIGVVTCSCTGPAVPHRLLGEADRLMYRAKAQGGSAIVCGTLESTGDP